jgi:hypothetical protein
MHGFSPRSGRGIPFGSCDYAGGIKPMKSTIAHKIDIPSYDTGRAQNKTNKLKHCAGWI